MTGQWPHIDDLIRELAEIRALPHANDERSLTEATIAVSKATAALARAAAQGRGKRADAILDEALLSIDAARRAIAEARGAIVHSRNGRPVRPAGARHEPRPKTAGEHRAEASCPACGLPFVVSYRAAELSGLVLMPVACPFAECEGVAEVDVPEAAAGLRSDPPPRPADE